MKNSLFTSIDRVRIRATGKRKMKPSYFLSRLFPLLLFGSIGLLQLRQWLHTANFGQLMEGTGFLSMALMSFLQPLVFNRGIQFSIAHASELALGPAAVRRPLTYLALALTFPGGILAYALS